MQTIQSDSLFVTNILLDGISLLIIAGLALRIVHTGRKITENRMYFGLCVMNAVLAVSTGVKYLFFILPSSDSPIAEIYGMICDPIVEIVSLMIVVQWLLFVEYTLHQSRDIIRRRYPIILIPFFVAVVLDLIGIFLIIVGFINSNFFLMYAGDTNRFLSLFILFLYLIVSYIIVYREKKRKKLPRYIVITPMAFCVILGIFFDTVTHYSLLSLSFAIGLASMEYSISKESSWEDEITGYYNESYLKIIMEYVTKNHEKGGTVIRFLTKDDRKALAGILHDTEPDNTKTVAMDNGTFLVVSETQTESVINFYQRIVNDQAKKSGITVESDHFTRTDETPEEFLTKVKRSAFQED